MDDWTYPYSDPNVDAPSSQPMLLDEVWGAVADRLRAADAEAGAQAEADGRAVEPDLAGVWDGVDDERNVLTVPLLFEAPAHTSHTY